MAVFQLAEWMTARVVAFPLAECRTNDQEESCVIHLFVRMGVDGHKGVHYVGWMKNRVIACPLIYM